LPYLPQVISERLKAETYTTGNRICIIAVSA
jgi:hypothetical protein